MAKITFLLTALLTAFSAQAAPTLVRDFADLEELVRTRHITQVEDLLPLLDPELRSNYSLIIVSSTRQGASLETPLVSVYSQDGRFSLSFAGDGSMRNGHTVETIHLDKTEMIYKFGRVRFESTGPVFERPGDSLTPLVYHSSTVVDAKAARLEAHPIWDSYPDWPDRYGHSYRIAGPLASGGSFGQSSPRLDRALNELKSRVETHPRYRFLTDLAQTNSAQLAAKNVNIGAALFATWLEKTAVQIKSHPRYSRYELAFQKADRPESEFLEALPLRERTIYLKALNRLRQTVGEGQKKYFLTKAQRYTQLTGIVAEPLWNPRNQAPPQTGAIARLARFDDMTNDYRERLDFLLQQMDLSVEILNLTRERGSYSANSGYADLTRLIHELSLAPTLCELALGQTPSNNPRP